MKLYSRLLLFVGVLFTFSSCDSGDGNIDGSLGDSIFEQTTGVHPRLQPHLDSFLLELDKRNIKADTANITIVFSQLPSNTGGLCFVGDKKIYISGVHYNDFDNIQYAVYHELGHCVLGMEHRSNSIMQTSGVFGITEASLNEFFTEEYFFKNGVSSPRGSELSDRTKG